MHLSTGSIARMALRVAASALTFALAVSSPFAAGGADPGDDLIRTSLMSRTPGGAPIGEVFDPTLSQNARWFVYATEEAALPRDQNGSNDVYLLDRHTEELELISVLPSGAAAGLSNGRLSISADGRFVGFQSLSSELVDGDTNDKFDVFVRDRREGVTERVSVGPGGVQSNDSASWTMLSADGNLVCFSSLASNLVPGDNNGEYDVFVHDRAAGVTERVSVSSTGAQGNDTSIVSRISGDGRIVVFESNASNLVPGDTNGARDVFYRDRVAGTTQRVSVATGGAQGNDCSMSAALSSDGDHVVFMSRATNLDPDSIGPHQALFVRDLVEGTTQEIHSVPVDLDFCHVGSWVQYPSISGDGRFVSFYATTNDEATSGVFRIDTQSPELERMDVSCTGDSLYATSVLSTISGDGRYVGFISSNPDLWPTIGEQNSWRAYLRGPGLPCASLQGSQTKLSASLGGIQTLRLSAGRVHAEKPYWLLGSSGGIFPGLPVGEVVLPLVPDGAGGYFHFTLTHPNEAPLSGSMGTLDSQGRASASFKLLPSVAAALAGMSLHHAYLVLDGPATTTVAASTPLVLTFLP